MAGEKRELWPSKKAVNRKKQPRRNGASRRRTQLVNDAAMPSMQVPVTARLRRKRNRRRVARPELSWRDLILSPRWLSLFLLIVSVYAMIVISSNDQYYLMAIGVNGENYLTEQEILQETGLLGTHIFTADLQQAKRALNELPTVISATVVVNWPNQANIYIYEDEPIAVWQQGESQYWVNRNGALIEAKMDIPDLIHIISEEPESEDGIPFVPQPVLEGAVQLWQLQPGLTTLYYRPAMGLGFDDPRGWRAYFGFGTDMAQKQVVYEALAADLLEREYMPVYISVTDYEKPFYKAYEINQ